MNVDRIYSRNIVSAPRSSSLGEAAALMRQHHVGALLITDDSLNENQVLGFVTDRDLVLQGLAEGVGPEDAAVGDVMTPNIASIASNADIHKAMEMMREHGIRRLAVSDSQQLVGVLSMDDIVDALAVETGSLAGILRTEREREVAQWPESAPLSL